MLWKSGTDVVVSKSGKKLERAVLGRPPGALEFCRHSAVSMGGGQEAVVGGERPRGLEPRLAGFPGGFRGLQDSTQLRLKKKPFPALLSHLTHS